jgi:hypothetical protein
VLKFRPNINITPYHANVKDSNFNVDFFKQFNVVLNGLDNLDARRHVNRLCLAAEVPLVESGTTGFLGQVRQPNTAVIVSKSLVQYMVIAVAVARSFGSLLYLCTTQYGLYFNTVGSSPVRFVSKTSICL